MKFYQHDPLRFRCTGCGACCIGGRNHYIAVSMAECESIRQYLGVSGPWFRRRYLDRLTAQQRGIRLREDGRCTFLGGDGKCTVYPVRPRQCRSYPFWPEIVSSRSAWRTEGRRCEGIGRGRRISTGRIRAWIAADNEAGI